MKFNKINNNYYKENIVKRLFLYIILLSFIGCNPITITNYSKTESVCKDDIAKQLKSSDKKEKINNIKCYFKGFQTIPKWLKFSPQDDTYIYGIGIAPKQESLEKQLIASELAAKSDLSSQVVIYIKSEYWERFENQNYINSEIYQYTKSVIKDFEIVEIWKNEKNCIIYTLLRVNKKNIKAIVNF